MRIFLKQIVGISAGIENTHTKSNCAGNLMLLLYGEPASFFAPRELKTGIMDGVMRE